MNPDRYTLPGALLAVVGMIVPSAWLGIRAGSLANWHIALGLCGLALLGWIYTYRRYRLYADTPMARISSAPQGYIALAGIGRPLPGEPLRSPFNFLPCLWYRMIVESRDSDGNWQKECDEHSDDSFVLEDRDGNQCTVDPVGAHVEVLHKDESRAGDRRTTQWLLIPGTRLHVIGHFATRRPIDDHGPAATEVRDRLADWKASGMDGLGRFDRNGDGTIDPAEWEAVREAARDEIETEREAVRDLPDYNVMHKPPDGRPFVISDHDPQQVMRRYRYQAVTVFALLIALLIATIRLATTS